VNLLIQRLGEQPVLAPWQQQQSCHLAPYLHRWTMWFPARRLALSQVPLRQSDPKEM
jgi:hypothetical protein